MGTVRTAVIPLRGDASASRSRSSASRRRISEAHAGVGTPTTRVVPSTRSAFVDAASGPRTAAAAEGQARVASMRATSVAIPSPRSRRSTARATGRSSRGLTPPVPG